MATPEPPPDSKKGNSAGALLGGTLLVGAAAGYALLALRFKNMHAAKHGMASAEMRAAEVMSEQASRVQWTSAARAEGRAEEAEAAAERLRRFAEDRRRQQAAREEARRRQGFQTPAEQRGAASLGELGLGGVQLGSLTPEQVKAAYHSKARECHPDSGGDPEAFKRVGRAYEEVLGLVKER